MPTHRYSTYFPIVFALFDLVCLNSGHIISNYIILGNWKNLTPEYTLLISFVNITWLIVFYFYRLYEINRETGWLEMLNQLLTSLILTLAALFTLWFIAQPVDINRKYIFYSFTIFSVLVIAWRTSWFLVIGYYRKKGYNVRNVVILGYSDLSIDLEKHFKKHPEFGYVFKGYFNEHQVDREDYLGKISNLENYFEKNNIDVIFCYLPAIKEVDIKRIIDFAENNLIKTKIISQFSRLGSNNLILQKYGRIPVLNVSAIPLDNSINQLLKRGFDLFFASFVLLVFLSWIIPLVGLLIKIESKGPVFFKQYRNGRNNKPFLCWKFRTMIVNKDADSKQATRNDPRVTKIGSILRKTSIDELPQFINVFLGEMSVVGPRPHPIKLNEEFQPHIDRFIQRHAVKPGITGLAQAKGFRGETAKFSDMSGRVKLDRFYVKHWSFILDFKIIVLTILTLLKNKNAY